MNPNSRFLSVWLEWSEDNKLATQKEPPSGKSLNAPKANSANSLLAGTKRLPPLNGHYAWPTTPLHVKGRPTTATYWRSEHEVGVFVLELWYPLCVHNRITYMSRFGAYSLLLTTNLILSANTIKTWANFAQNSTNLNWLWVMRKMEWLNSPDAFGNRSGPKCHNCSEINLATDKFRDQRTQSRPATKEQQVL